ncbi:hypothetical protein BX611_1577 [Lutibacter oceani]|uniref:Uncharacterized protein n=1 Tax=Lutibacter oceani TaxID=1853311 RepID=A0A3D9RWS5_9FLAO|nr:hypothetical protein [Lutibacter oceani]REE82034.1 hypothetical protein BX611_1577 [Lutibacter oceani]
MKKLITLFVAFTLFSCNDGDFDVPAFEFTDTVNSCGEYLLYKLNTEKTEAIIISLSPTQLGTIAGEKTYTISSTLKVTYRLFDEAIGTDYFCQEIPPSTPIVLKELDAESGTLIINTIEVVEDEVITGYEYEISISNLLFLDNNERIFFETFSFGVFDN